MNQSHKKLFPHVFVLLIFFGIAFIVQNKTTVPDPANDADKVEAVPEIIIEDGNLSIYKNGLLVETFKESSEGVSPHGFHQGILSPNNNFVLMTAGIGDFLSGWIYDMEKKSLHEIDVGLSGILPYKWLPDNRLEIHEGCVLASYCKRYQSIDSSSPWILELVEDLGR